MDIIEAKIEAGRYMHWLIKNAELSTDKEITEKSQEFLYLMKEKGVSNEIILSLITDANTIRLGFNIGE